MKHPKVQVALDVIELDDAVRLAEVALDAGADWLEIGKPFVEFNGIRGCDKLTRAFPDQYWLLDLMVMASPAKYLDAAAGLGISNVTVTGLAPMVTVATAVEHARTVGVAVTIDLFNVANLRTSCGKYAALEPDYLMVHFGVDQKRAAPAGSPVEDLSAVVAAASCPVSYATYDLEESLAAVAAGASVIVQGEPLLSRKDAPTALRQFITTTHDAGARRAGHTPAPLSTTKEIVL
ncbi:orotidine 5'-phosphate decarboxylase / HUMPS family protein [Pedococcus sp. 5OH_020]|uniref:orotidine 5'-phosphate decarboxylase / HUMPS family protein n=1 Tax=Pedococcus sp. 5OH_020 TaxID=2989814 RepID=UPI0022EA0805|nr:orotidine 5'-phosphate decarboxylase / HUMPS family protein [Pedococcus sp. 5OH_020]